MTSKRLHLILSACIGILFVGLLAGAYGINSLLTSEATKLTNLKAKSIALSEQHVSLKKAQKDVKKYADLKKITQAVVPEDKNQAAAVREIVNIAAANGVSLAAINFPASTLGASPTGSTTTTTSTPSASANSKASALSQLKPVKNIPGVYNLLITVQSDSNRPVQYSKFINFLSALERNRRTAQVETISLEPNKDNRNLLSFTLTLNEYIKP
jgi:hypothetical protein